jgi:hypothetical protein
MARYARTLAGLVSMALLPFVTPVSAGSLCSYDVTVSRSLALDIQAACDPGVRSLVPTDASLRGYISDIQGEHSSTGFTGAYRVDLAVMAKSENSIDSALRVGDTILTVGSAWLLKPQRGEGEPGTLRVRVRMPAGLSFVTGQPVTDGVFGVPEAQLYQAGFSAFGRFRTEHLRVAADEGDSAGFEVVRLDGSVNVGRKSLLDWIGRMAGAAAGFWHGFPAPGMPIFVVPRAGHSGVPFGRVMSGGGVSMALYVGEHATPAELDNDWVLIHELVHTGSPFVRGAPWFSEGLATYFEPLIRARAGLQTPEAMWTEFMTHMPRAETVMAAAGLARGGFRGWYYGGALLMLLTDVRMREASGGDIGLENCLRRIRRDVGNFSRTLNVHTMISMCDAAVGGHVLRDAVRVHAYNAGPVDLGTLWGQLGLRLEGGHLTYDDSAPLAGIRKALVRGHRDP